MTSFVDINLPKESADSYYMESIQHLVDDFIYIDPEWYKQLFDPTTFYILGPKGSGKTLYATYMCADIRRDTISKYHKISVDDYGKIIEMKNKGHLSFTDYSTIWKVIILQKLLCGIDEKDISFWGRSKSFQAIRETIFKHFGYSVIQDNFNPVTQIDSYGKQTEITNYLNGELGSSITAANMFSGSVGLKNEITDVVTDNNQHSKEHTRSQYTDTWLQSIDSFKRTLEIITLRYDYYLFIDGLDVRPTQYDAAEYGECIGALIRAVYDLNTQVFGNRKRRNEHRFKIIALTRTDIFLNSNLVNVTSCINDNCVELDWTYSNETNFLYSKLYKMMNRVLGWDGISPEMPAQIFFGFPITLGNNRRPLAAALYIQRLSRLRPRDIVVFLNLIQKECRARGCPNPDSIIIQSSDIIEHYSQYYIEQVRSEMKFSYSDAQIFQILAFLRTFRNARMAEREFESIFNKYCKYNSSFRTLFTSHRALIDVLYSLDVLGWVEFQENYLSTKTIIHWHYRETKAIDEHHRLPWEIYDNALSETKFVIHNGATRYILGQHPRFSV